MKTRKTWTNALALALAVILAAGLLAGCYLIESKPDSATAADDQGRAGAMGRYYDFDDIQVPTKLKLNKDKSVLFRAGTLTAGMLFVSENVEVEGLISFFIDSMNRDNWTLKSSYKYPRAMLFFAKASKTCVIVITEHTFATDVEIWVAPAMQQ